MTGSISSVPPDVPLSDGVVSLRPWRIGDAPAVAAACQDPRIPRWIPIPQPYTMADAVAFVSGEFEHWEKGHAPFAVVDARTDVLLGAMTLHPARGHVAEIGYWLAPGARGRGVATRALLLLVHWAFDSRPLDRLEIFHAAGNDASGAVARRAGFQFEGILRHRATLRGVLVDMAVYSLLRSDVASPDP